MATIPQPERTNAINGLLRISGEDAEVAARLLDYLQFAFPGFDWAGILRIQANAYAPFIASGLTIWAWCDEVIRQAANIAASRG